MKHMRVQKLLHFFIPDFLLLTIGCRLKTIIPLKSLNILVINILGQKSKSDKRFGCQNHIFELKKTIL